MIFEVIHTFWIAFLVLGSVLGTESNTRQEATNLDLDTWMLRANGPDLPAIVPPCSPEG